LTGVAAAPAAAAAAVVVVVCSGKTGSIKLWPETTLRCLASEASEWRLGGEIGVDTTAAAAAAAAIGTHIP